MVATFEFEKRNYYTYQLKSSKGLVVVVKGIDSSVPISEIKEEIEAKGFEVKSIANILNKNKIPQPMFKVELSYESSQVRKKGDTHPIYDIIRLCNRRVTVEEPLKRKDPPQCTNCQEFGHTRTYCRLPPVCVRCGDIHKSKECPHTRTDSNVKKCSNCGANHTANYRGCPVYAHLKKSFNAPRKPVYARYTPSPFPGLNSIAPMENASANVNIPQVAQNKLPQNISYSH